MTDDDYMKLAFAMARRAEKKGNAPFGAILVDRNGDVAFEAINNVISDSDCTGHAETNLVRDACLQLGVGALGDYTLYTSAEPCCMCSAAMIWAGLGRLVFGLSSARLTEVRGGGAPMLDITSREVVSRSPANLIIDGPLLEDEAAALFAPAA